MENIIPNIINWAEKSNRILGSDLKTETLKLVSELSELSCCINKVGKCPRQVGICLIRMIIICRMKNISLLDCIDFTEEITEKRITNRRYALKEMNRHVGNLAHNIVMNKSIKADIGYLLIYLTILTRIVHYSMRECLILAFNEISSEKGVMFNGKFIQETDEDYHIAITILNSTDTDNRVKICGWYK